MQSFCCSYQILIKFVKNWARQFYQVHHLFKNVFEDLRLPLTWIFDRGLTAPVWWSEADWWFVLSCNPSPVIMMSTWPDMKMAGKPLGPPISSSNCFTGRYSPTYRVPEHQMKRCPTNTVRRVTNDYEEDTKHESLSLISSQIDCPQWTIKIRLLPKAELFHC